MRRVGIIGAGRFGMALAQSLAESGTEVLLLDRNGALVQRALEVVSESIQGDATSARILEEAGFAECDVAVVAIGSNIEASTLALANCKDLGIGDAVKEKALAILKDTDGKDISSGRNRAAACIYIAGKQCGEAKTLSDLAKCARTTEGLIRDKAKEVKDKLKIDVEIEEPSTEEEKKE